MAEPLPATPRRIAWLHFANDFTLDFLTPFLPTGVPAAWVGVMEGVADAIGQALKLVTGRASDASGRRVRWVAAGYGLNALARPLAGVGLFLGWPFWIIACRVADRVGKGLRGSASDALVADWTQGEMRARAYAANRFMDHVGATCGGLAALALAWFAPHLIAYGVIGLALPALLVLLLCRGLADHPDAAPKSGPPPGWWPREPALRLPLALLALASLARLGPLLVLVRVGLVPDADAGDAIAAHAAGQAAGAWQPWKLALFWCALSAVQAVAAAGAGWATARLGARRFLVVGYVVGALVLAGLAGLHGAALVAAGLGYGALAGLTEGAEKTWLAELAPKHERATAFGALAILMALAALAGNAGVGFAFDAGWAAPALFTLCGVQALAALGLLARRWHGPAPTAG